MSIWEEDSRETLRRVEQNDATLTKLFIGEQIGDDVFDVKDNGDYSRLGSYIGQNTHLATLNIWMHDGVALEAANDGFYEGLKQNSSINELDITCGRITAGGVNYEILKAYQENNAHLTRLRVAYTDLQNGGDDVIAATMRQCRNLTKISLTNNSITDEQLYTLVEASRGHASLEELYLSANVIGHAGCDAISSLLQDPNCNLQILSLETNVIDNVGAATLENGLSNNTKLQELNLGGNPIDRCSVDIFNKLLCDVSNINTMHSSNHTLEKVGLSQWALVVEPVAPNVDRTCHVRMLTLNCLDMM